MVRLFSFVLLTFYSLHSTASIEVCGLDNISLTKDHLLCMKKNSLTEAVLISIGTFKESLIACPYCKEPFINANKFLNLYKRDFLALGISKHSFGGYNLYGVFKNAPYVYKLWFYEINTDQYKLRKLSPTNKKVTLLNPLKNSKLFQSFWVSLNKKTD